MKTVTICTSDETLWTSVKRALVRKRIRYKEFEILDGTKRHGIVFKIPDDSVEGIEKYLNDKRIRKRVSWYSIDTVAD